MRTRDLSTEQIQRTIDTYNHTGTIPMVLVGSAALKLHMRERMAIEMSNPTVDTLSTTRGIETLISDVTSGKIDATPVFRLDGAGELLLRLSTDRQALTVPMNISTGFHSDAYSVSFEEARAAARHNILSYIPVMPLADALNWKLSTRITVGDVRQIWDILDVATIDHDLASEQIEQISERLRQKSALGQVEGTVDDEEDWRYLM